MDRELFDQNNLISIYVINSIDCYHLKLLEADLLTTLLTKFNSLAENAGQPEIDAMLMSVIKENKSGDIRTAIDPSRLDWNGHSPVLTTVMPVLKFFALNGAILSKVDRSLKALSSDDEGPEAWTAEQIRQAFQRINANSEQGKLPLVLKASVTIWATPLDVGDEIEKLDASGVRDKLGLNHLPRVTDSKNTRALCAAEKILIRLPISIENLDGAELKRPCMLDRPSNRFRALSFSETRPECKLTNDFGYTVDLEGTEYNDGFRELILSAKETGKIKKWRVSIINGELTDPNTHKESHRQFRDHLLSIRPQNQHVCLYRLSSDKPFYTELQRCS